MFAHLDLGQPNPAMRARRSDDHQPFDFMKNTIVIRFVLIALAAAAFAGCSAEAKKARSLEKAGNYYKEGAYDKALIEYQNVLQQDPQNTAAIERLAQIWWERGSPLRAVPYLLNIKSASPGNLDARVKLAQALLGVGKAGEARKEVMQLLERSSNFPEALVVLTEAVRSPDDFKAAEQALVRVADKNTSQYNIANANLLFLKGDIAGAKTSLQRAVSANPESSAARLALAAFHATQNDAAQALAEYKAAAAASPVRSLARMKYATALAQSGTPAEATAYLADIARQAPDYLPTYRLLSELSLLEKKYDEALAHLEKLFSRDPMEHEGRILRARVWLAQGNTQKAIEELERFGRDFPGLGVQYHSLALAYLQANEEAKAIVALQSAVAYNPDNTEALMLWAQLNLRAGNAQAVATAMGEFLSYRTHIKAYLLLIDAARMLGQLDHVAKVMAGRLKVTPRDVQLHHLLGLVYVQLAKPAEARQSFEKAVELDPGVVPSIAELFNLDLNEKKFPAALQRVQALAAKMPTAALPHYLKARVHAAKAEWNEAEAEVLKTLELDARYPGAYQLLTETLLARQPKSEAIARLESVLAKRPNDELATIMAAQVHAKFGDPGKAREVYERHLTAKPDSSLVLNNLANIYADEPGQLDRALEYAQKARAGDSASPAIADTLGWILYKKKAYNEALPLIQEGAAKLPLAEVQYHLGMVNKMLGNDEAARNALRLAAQSSGTFPGKDEATRELAQMEKTPSPTPPVDEKKSGAK